MSHLYKALLESHVYTFRSKSYHTLHTLSSCIHACDLVKTESYLRAFVSNVKAFAVASCVRLYSFLNCVKLWQVVKPLTQHCQH